MICCYNKTIFFDIELFNRRKPGKSPPNNTYKGIVFANRDMWIILIYLSLTYQRLILQLYTSYLLIEHY